MTHTRFSIADVTVDVVGKSRVAHAVVTTLAEARTDSVTQTTGTPTPRADITLQIGRDAPAVNVERTERARRLPYRFDTAVTTDGMRYQMSTFRGRVLYTVDLHGLPHRSSSWTATATIPDLGWLRLLPPALIRAATHEHGSMIDYFTAVAINEVLEPLLWTQLLDRDRTFIHAAAGVTPDGRGVAFTGAGQVGKTSIALGLVRQHGWRYLADDRVIVGTDGMHRAPRPLRLGAHHLAILDDVTTVDGMSQNTRRRRSRRRIAITDVISADRLASAAPLDAVVNVFATPATTTLRTHQMSRGELVDNITAAIVSDFWEFLGFMNAAAALSPAAAAYQWHRRVAAIVETSLPATILGIDVPVGHDLNHVSEFIAETV